jgi:hypothetical protein
MIAGRPDHDFQVLLLEDNAPTRTSSGTRFGRRASTPSSSRSPGGRGYVEALDGRAARPGPGGSVGLRAPGRGGAPAARGNDTRTSLHHRRGARREAAGAEEIKEGATDYVLKAQLARLGPPSVRALEEKSHDQQRERAEHRLRFIADCAPVPHLRHRQPVAVRLRQSSLSAWFGLSPDENPGRRVWEVMGDAAFARSVPTPSGRSPASGWSSRRWSVQGMAPRWVSASYTPDVGPDGAGLRVLRHGERHHRTEEDRGGSGVPVGSHRAPALLARLRDDARRHRPSGGAPRGGLVLRLLRGKRAVPAAGHDPSESRPGETAGGAPERYPASPDLPFAYPKVLRTGSWDLVPEITEDHLRRRRGTTRTCGCCASSASVPS